MMWQSLFELIDSTNRSYLLNSCILIFMCRICELDEVSSCLYQLACYEDAELRSRLAISNPCWAFHKTDTAVMLSVHWDFSTYRRHIQLKPICGHSSVEAMHLKKSDSSATDALVSVSHLRGISCTADPCHSLQHIVTLHKCIGFQHLI